MPEILIVVVLGILEGLTEFIPVSSTGHLILLGDALGFKGDRAATFDVFIQLGAILAVVVLYWPRFLSLLDFKSNSGFAGKQGLIKLALGCFPALMLGFVAHHYIKEHLFTPATVASALIAGALLMLLVERRRPPTTVTSVEDISLATCLGVGFFQCLSLWPGFSRSGSTILGGMFLGIERSIAAEFSFLMAVPVMCAATGYDLVKSLKFLNAEDLMPFTLGFAVSFVSALLAIRFFVALLRRYTLAPFAYYRIALGLLVWWILL